MNNHIKVTIKEMSPLLMHAFPMVEIKNTEKLLPEEQAELAAYRDPQTKDLYIPAVALQRCIVAGATFSKGKGKASLQKIVAACLFVTPERCSLHRKEYLLDARPVVIPATKGRVIRYRPRLDKWECSFELEYDPTLLTEKQVHQVMEDSGKLVGILDFRPQCKGSFGRFMITKWDITKE
jgi:hypothetical protein